MTSYDIDLVLFDVGGVLGTDSWGHGQRAAAVDHFGLDAEDFAARHAAVAPTWEEGMLTMDQYLDSAVFYEPRSFSRETFRDYMFAQSRAFPDAIELVEALRMDGEYRMMTLNNEAPELNDYRIRHFKLAPLFDAFLSSCYLGVRKPMPAIYQRALEIAHVPANRTVFIDDREQNLAPARALGIHTVHFTTVPEVTRRLVEIGVSPYTD